MSASPRKQLNIRSDEARAIAHAIAAETGMTVTQIVETALREFRTGRRIPSTKVTPQEADRNRTALLAALDMVEAPAALPAPAKPDAPQPGGLVARAALLAPTIPRHDRG